MMTRTRRLAHRPVFLLCLTAFLTSFVVQSGELGSSDTAHRLQAAHSFWTSEPPVFPDEYPEFGIHGRNGKLYGWYDIGQSLLMLPSDVVGTYLEQLPAFADYEDDPSVRAIVVSYSTSTLVCVLTILVCFRFLRRLRFTINQALAGALALLFCTTFLHYTQNMMENNYIMLLTLTGLTFQYEWLRSGSPRALLIGSCALGLNLLTRLTTGMELLAVGLFLLLALWWERVGGRALWLRFVAYMKVAAPVYALFVLIDRAYQYYRFGSFFNTYIQIYGEEQKRLNPGLPAKFPFETPFHVGFLGPLITPEKSIFLFDPLLVLTAIIAVLLWRRFSSEIRAYLIAFALLLFACISFYATYTDWSGDFAWGDRYVSTEVQLAVLLSVPLLLRHRKEVSRHMWAAAMIVIAVSVLVQLASVMFWCPLEIYQMDTLGHPTCVVYLRFKNIVAFALAKMDRWDLVNDSMKADPWDYVHISTYNFLPFLLKRTGQAAPWVVKTSYAVWAAALAALLALLSFLSKHDFCSQLDEPREVGLPG
ncbi:MAG TPA: glycosyltransferase family 39 protein [Acidobacteriota bacterium]|jgi:hypothetical protein